MRFAGLAALALLVGACGGTKTTVDVGLKEYEVAPAVSSVKAGKVTFSVKNNGTVMHEMVVFKTDLAEGALPVKGDTVNEDDPALASQGEVEDVKPGTTKSFTADLKPGAYVLICNVETHYAKGMHVSITVT